MGSNRGPKTANLPTWPFWTRHQEFECPVCGVRDYRLCSDHVPWRVSAVAILQWGWGGGRGGRSPKIKAPIKPLIWALFGAYWAPSSPRPLPSPPTPLNSWFHEVFHEWPSIGQELGLCLDLWRIGKVGHRDGGCGHFMAGSTCKLHELRGLLSRLYL